MILNNTRTSASENELKYVLRELHRARIATSDISCLIWFVADNDENTAERNPTGGFTETVVTVAQFQGYLLIADQVIVKLGEIKQTILRNVPQESETASIIASIDDGIKMISIGTKLARIRFDCEEIQHDRICLSSAWISGFFAVLQLAKGRMRNLFSDITEIHDRIGECLNFTGSYVAESSVIQASPDSGGRLDDPIH